MLISIHFIDLSEKLKYHIINSMLISFNKTGTIKNQNDYQYIYDRFHKKSCMVHLYYEDSKLQGVSIIWSYNNYIYLDKFFSLNIKKRIGTKMLDLLINIYNNNQSIERNNQYKNKILWRTDIQTSLFYLKHPKIITHFKNTKYDITYMGVKRIIWEYEDIYNIKIKSCFT